MSTLLRVVIAQSRKPSTETKEELVESPKPAAPPQPSGILLPTSEETRLELKRRLYQEIYTAEGDLAGGLVIAGKPCQCLEGKHTWEMEAKAKELIPEDPNNTVYLDIIEWIKRNQAKVDTEAIASGKYKQEYPQMAAQFRDFRKRIMSAEDWRLAREQAKKGVGNVVDTGGSTTVKIPARQAKQPPTFDEAWKVVEQQAKTDANKLVITQVPISPTTLEQAKKLAAEEAAKEVG